MEFKYTYSIQVEEVHVVSSLSSATSKSTSSATATTTTEPSYKSKPSLTSTATSTILDTNSLMNSLRTLYHGLRLKTQLLSFSAFRKSIIIGQSNREHRHRNDGIVDNDNHRNEDSWFTPEFTFQTPPKPVSSSSSSSSSSSPYHTSSSSSSSQSELDIKPTKFAIVGDLGQTYNSSMTMKNILLETKSITSASTTPVSLLLIAGDMSYANSIQPQWDTWFDLIEPITTSIPLIVAAGNHEIECDVISHLPFIPYENRFYMPNRIGDADIGVVDESYFHSKWGCAAPSVFQGHYDFGNAYFSFNYGMVKTIVLSSYSETSVNSNQYKWLQKELQSVNRIDTPWIIIMMHTQFYTTFRGHDDEYQTNEMHEAMEPLFYEYGVNFVFSGHDHAYMRTKNMFNYAIDKHGPIYFILGEGGNREHHIKYYIHDKPEEWVNVRDKSVYGFGTFEVRNRTHVHWKWIMDPNDDGLTFTDDVWLTNNHFYKGV